MSNPDHKILTVGIWIQLPPRAHWSGEGLTRLLNLITEGSNPDLVRFKFLTPRWLHNEIADDVKNWGENSNKIIEVEKTPGKMPIITRQYLKYLPGNSPVFSLSALRASNPLALLKKAVTLKWFIPMALTAPLWIIPLLVIYVGSHISRRLLKLVFFKKVATKLRGIKTWQVNLINKYKAKTGLKITKYVLQNEYKSMVRHGNRMDVDVWYTGHPGFTEAQYLNAPLVVMFADFVVGEFPHLFPAGLLQEAERVFSTLIPKAAKYITISNHVAERHVFSRFKIPREKVVTIPHAPTPINVNASYLPKNVYRTNESRNAAAEIIRGYCRSNQSNWPVKGTLTERLILPYLNGFPFEEIDYILVSTQNRPYKNTIAAIKAIEELIRKRQRNVKLIMTGDSGIDNPHSIEGDYIRKHKLHFDAISIPRVPREVHAALYHCALAAVQPTFYEGGTGSWIFFEAMSLGTPALVSRILATMESDFDPEFKEQFFNPNNFMKIADQIEEVIDHREDIYKKQLKWYNAQLTRSWNVVADEYTDVFKQVANENS